MLKLNDKVNQNPATIKEEKRKRGRPKKITEKQLSVRQSNMIAVNEKKAKLKGDILAIVNKLDKSTINDIAKVTGLSVRATRAVLTSQKAFAKYRRRQARALDVVGFSSLLNLAKTINNGRVSPYQAGVMFSMLYDKVYRPEKGADPLAVVNVGDNRQVKVFYPNFTQKDKKAEYNTAEDIKE